MQHIYYCTKHRWSVIDNDDFVVTTMGASASTTAGIRIGTLHHTRVGGCQCVTQDGTTQCSSNKTSAC